MDIVELKARSSEKFPPNPVFAKQANLNEERYQLLKDKANNHYEAFWAELAQEKIAWGRAFTKTLTCQKHPFYRWFEDGLLNVSYNCLDRHLEKNADKTAIIFEGDDGQVETISYRALYEKVCQFANGLLSLGVQIGDRVVIYMPHSIEVIVAMLACSRIGAVHSVVFAGFSARSLADRVMDAGAKLIVTANASMRGGKEIPLKQTVDDAIQLLPDRALIRHVIVQQRVDIPFHFDQSLDILWDDLIVGRSMSCPPVMVDSEHPLFVLYTSGSTGAPKGVRHSSAGYLLGAMLTMEWVFDLKENDVFWCSADVGWITGHTYVCYGPLAMGATQVVFEGVPTHPDAGRFWQMIQSHRVTTFYTAPTALRSLIKLGERLPAQFDLSSLRLLGSVGEPINPEVWLWYYNVVGEGRCPIVDTWWQTETGCHMLSAIPGVNTLKPGSCVLPIPGVLADVIDESGNSVEPYEKGVLVIKKPFPSLLRTVWGNDERFMHGYYPEHVAGGRYYVAGDAAYRDSDGYFWILGRVDDVLNVSGHRLGTQEIESALIKHPAIAEVAVVGRPHPVKGESVFAFVTCKNEFAASTVGLIEELRLVVAKEIGAIAKPDNIIFVRALPKTRSGKIMRRLLRAIARDEEIAGDLSTLDNPSVIDEIKKMVNYS